MTVKIPCSSDEENQVCTITIIITNTFKNKKLDAYSLCSSLMMSPCRTSSGDPVGS